MSLVDDRAVLTALANDIGFELVFSRQIIAHAAGGDIAVGFSTSGDSVNVLRGLEECSRRGLLTIGLSGYEGGAMAASPAVVHCLVVRSESVHRIQEAQNALLLQLWTLVQAGLNEGELP
jgi:D-sedoheptulose 7-phosphate isomerase